MGGYNRDLLIRIIILCGFSVFYFSRALSDSLAVYVHPRMVPYVLFSAIVMLVIGFMMSNGIQGKDLNFHLRKYILFLIPLAAAWLIPPESLAGASGIRSEYQNSSGTIRTSEPSDNPSEITTAQGTPITESASTAFPELSSEPPSEIEILMKLNPIPMEGSCYTMVMSALYENPDQYKGRRITTTGFVFRVQDFDADCFVPARMMMTCCAADAMPVGLMCRYDHAEGLEDGQWVTLEGILSETVYNGEQIPVIEVSHLESSETIDDYVYP